MVFINLYNFDSYVSKAQYHFVLVLFEFQLRAISDQCLYNDVNDVNMHSHMYRLHVCVHAFMNMFVNASINFVPDEDEHFKVVHVSIIVLGICTLGTSILLWWLYKELVKWHSSKDEYDMKSIHLCSLFVFVYIRIYVFIYTYIHHMHM